MKWSMVPLCALAAACASSPGIVDTGRVDVVESTQLPAPTVEDLTLGQRPHLIGPFDSLSIEVFGIQDLSREVRVDASGQVSLPAAGVIDVIGKSPAELAQVIEDRMRANHVRNPQVTVNVRETISQVVTVDGEVKRPGIYPVAGRMTMLRAIARAEGTSEFAQARHVVVLRTVNKRQMAALYDVRAIRMGAYEDPEIYPNDVIVVGESAARRIFPQLLQAGTLLATPVLTVLR